MGLTCALQRNNRHPPANILDPVYVIGDASPPSVASPAIWRFRGLGRYPGAAVAQPQQ